MNKLDLIQTLYTTNGLSKVEATKVINLFFDQMATALEKGDRVEIRSLFSFSVKEYEGYTGYHPRDRHTITVAPKKLPYFKCTKGLKEQVDK